MNHSENDHLRDDQELKKEIEKKELDIHELEEVLKDEQQELAELEAEEHHRHGDDLHIYVNNIKYDKADGVKEVMTGKEIIDLVPIDPPENAELTREGSDVLIGLTETLNFKCGERFEAIRKKVDAGKVDLI